MGDFLFFGCYYYYIYIFFLHTYHAGFNLNAHALLQIKNVIRITNIRCIKRYLTLIWSKTFQCISQFSCSIFFKWSLIELWLRLLMGDGIFDQIKRRESLNVLLSFLWENIYIVPLQRPRQTKLLIFSVYELPSGLNIELHGLTSSLTSYGS